MKSNSQSLHQTQGDSFLAIGAAFVFGLWPGHNADFSNLTDHGGFAPNGWAVVLSGVVVAMFSMVGPEIATVAAAESSEPEKAVAKAANSVIYRVGVFYIGSVLLLAIIVPWTDIVVGQSPFVSALDTMGIPGGPDIMNAVVLIAVLSCLNSGLYTSSRMLFTLAQKGDAPQFIAKLDKRAVPRNSLVLATVVGFVCVGLDYLSPDTVFAFLLNASGATILMVYLMIALSQIKIRSGMTRDEAAQLKLKMWMFPTLSILAAAGITAVLVSMFVVESTRSQIALSAGALITALIAYGFRRQFNPEPARVEDNSGGDSSVAPNRATR